MSDVFILGAGFSKAVAEEMPLLGELGRAVSARVDTRPPPVFAGDIEMWLSYLSDSHPWLSEAENLRNRALFLDVSVAIREVLSECENKAIENTCPDWLRNLVSCWHENQASVLTLNYDTMVERAVRTIELERPERTEGLFCPDLYPVALTSAVQRTGGFTGGPPIPSLRLFKLHGSTNWFYSGSPSLGGETIYYSMVSEWRREDEQEAQAYCDAVKDKVPLIVPPLMEKTPFFRHETIRTLWRLAGQALQSASRVFCLGYSLPQTDVTMRFFLTTSASADRVPFFVVDLSGDTLQRCQESLGRTFTVDGRFVRAQNSVFEFVHALDEGSIQ